MGGGADKRHVKEKGAMHARMKHARMDRARAEASNRE